MAWQPLPRRRRVPEDQERRSLSQTSQNAREEDLERILSPINWETVNKYKIYFKDTGLLIASLDEESQEDLRVNKNLNIYKGALWENAIGECLSKQGYNLYYYKKENSTLEEDFFIRTKKSLVPVEVKATNGNSKSLQTLIKSDSYPDIKEGIKLTNGNIGFENNIHTFPHFCGFLLKRYLSEVDF